MKLSLNTATIRKQWTLAQAIDGCARHGIGGISPWRDQVAAMGLNEAASSIKRNGLTVTGLCRGGFFTAPGWRDEERRPQPPATPAPIQLSDDEIEQLASAEGWEREEVDALRGLLGRPQPAPDTPAPDAQPEPVPPAAPPIQVNLPVMGRLPELPAETGQPSPDWLRGRRGPAANTYRRLRRIFQG